MVGQVESVSAAGCVAETVWHVFSGCVEFRTPMLPGVDLTRPVFQSLRSGSRLYGCVKGDSYNE